MSQPSESLLSTQSTEPMSSPNILSAYNAPEDPPLPEQRLSGSANKRRRQFSRLVAEDDSDDMHPSKLDGGKRPRIVNIDYRDGRYWTVERNWRLVKLRRSGLHWESLQAHFPGQSRADLAFQYDCVADSYDEGMMNQCAYLYQEFKSVLWREIASRIGCTPDKAEGMIVGVNQLELARRAVSFELAQMNEPIQNVSTITNSLPAAFGRLQGCVATPFVVQLPPLVARFRSQRKAALWIHGQMCTGSQNFRPFRAVIATSQSTSELLRNSGVAYGSRTEALLQSRVRNAIVTKKEAFFARRTLALVALALFEASFHDDQNCAAFTDPLNVGSGLGGDLIP
ncbi:hypothetical protein TCE0_047f17666 [Talaromyces pinophilus]|uniref:Uncharacterized protein n=1 Tax=Talaromyces pinophilus TaxID=128442 RepID=A0A0B8N1V0_TALPI|nr:hypothetical protein TCE0_047f17666 [Talaromyces pinophilus]